MRKNHLRWTPGLCLIALLGLMLAVAACDSAPSPTAPPPPGANSAPVPGGDSFIAGGPDQLALGFGAEVPTQKAARGEACKAPKVQICHRPPGNLDNSQEICVAESAVAAHEAHGDQRGACDSACIDLGCPCFSCGELAANGDVAQCGENFPGFLNLAGMIWTNGNVACSGESCAGSGLPTTCAITNPLRSQVVSAGQDAACRAMILASCPNPN